MPKCEMCGQYFNLEKAKKEFNHYFSESSQWKYEWVIKKVLCDECAIGDASLRWMEGTLVDEFEGTYD